MARHIIPHSNGTKSHYFIGKLFHNDRNDGTIRLTRLNEGTDMRVHQLCIVVVLQSYSSMRR
jgi:hypothetical protein